MHTRSFGLVTLLLLSFAACTDSDPGGQDAAVDGGGRSDTTASDGTIDVSIDMPSIDHIVVDRGADDTSVDRGADGRPGEAGPVADGPRGDISSSDSWPDRDGQSDVRFGDSSPDIVVDGPVIPPVPCTEQATGTCACWSKGFDGGRPDGSVSVEGGGGADASWGVHDLDVDRTCFCSGPYAFFCSDFATTSSQVCTQFPGALVAEATFTSCTRRFLRVSVSQADGGRPVHLVLKYDGNTFVGARLWNIGNVCMAPEGGSLDVCEANVMTVGYDAPDDPACTTSTERQLCNDAGIVDSGGAG
jgi:hypothetical protein